MLLNLYDTTSRGTRLGPVYLLSASPLQHASPQHHTTPLQCLNPLQNSYQEIIQQLFYENSQKCAIPDPGTPYLGHPAQSPSWVASHLSSNFHPRRQRTMSGEAPLHLDLMPDIWVKYGTQFDLTRPSIFRVAQQFLFL